MKTMNNLAEDSAANILEALEQHASTLPDQIAFTWVDKDCKEQRTVTYRQLEESSNAVAAYLLQPHHASCKRGDRIMIAYPFGLDFLAGMLGVMKIGAIPCSVYPPNPTTKTKLIKESMKQFHGFAQDAGATIALTTCSFANTMKAASVVYRNNKNSAGVRWVGTDHISNKVVMQLKKKNFERSQPSPEEIAFIQYTSGSTGRPKGVMISHRSLVDNCKVIADIGGAGPGFVGCLWVPQYHDMGLIGGYMTSLFAGVHLVCASPLDFISRPLLWADMVERYEAAFTCAPNFSFALLLKRLAQAKRISDWSHVKRAIFGGEPTQSSVVRDVISKLQMKPENVWNMYGIAECGLCVTAGAAAVDGATGLVSCGEISNVNIPGKVKILSKNGSVVEDGEEGTIFVQSSRVATGYYGQEKETSETFQILDGEPGRWLDTGDIGNIVGGNLYVTGRVKDVIIINGKNYFPSDVEHAVDEMFGHDIIRPGCSAAFQVTKETIGVTIEPRKTASKEEVAGIAEQVASHILSSQALLVQVVLVLKPGSNPKTTSGKLKRSTIKQLTLDNNWGSVVLNHYERNKGKFGPGIHENQSCRKAENKSRDRTVTLQDITISDDLSGSRQEGTTFHSKAQAAYANVLGTDFQANKTWSENGMNSLKRSELVSTLQEEFRIEIPAMFEELYQTPRELEAFLASSTSTAFRIQDVHEEHPDYDKHSPSKDGPTLTKLQLGVLQALGILVLVALFALSLFPSYYAGKEVSRWNEKIDAGNVSVKWRWLPVVVPLFLISMTLEAVIIKWLVIGRYQKQEIHLLSWNYLRWWFVDTWIALWELFVGNFIIETKLLWLAYRLLGSDISVSASTDSYIREFDLVQVGEFSTLSHSIKCRIFRPWRGEGNDCGLRLGFRPIRIGSDCQIYGFVSPGSSIGDGSKVARLSAVAEGAQVPINTLAQGTPAYNAGQFEPSLRCGYDDLVHEMIKILWLFVQCYLFFGLFLLSEIIVKQTMSGWIGFRYAPLLFWVLALPLTSMWGLLVSIAMKWLLVGKRSLTENYGDSLYRRTTNWICDYHYRMSVFALIPVFGVSRIWNVILYLHGLDIDFVSALNAGYDLWGPSQVDYFKIRRSFVSFIKFDMKTANGAKTEIIESSIGKGSCLGLGVEVIRSAVPPCVTIQESFLGMSPYLKDGVQISGWDILGSELAQLALIPVLFVSFLPSYEVFMVTTYDSTSTWFAFLGVSGSILTQASVWLVLRNLIEAITLNCPSTRAISWLYPAYMNHTFLNQTWSLQRVLHGTPFFGFYMRFMGAQLEGNDLWCFDTSIYDCRMLRFGDQTIVDSCSINGHYVDAQGLTIEKAYVSGVVHPASLVLAGAMVSSPENGPYKVFLRSGAGKNNKLMDESSAFVNDATAKMDLSEIEIWV